MNATNNNAAETIETTTLAAEMEKACDAVSNTGGSIGKFKQTAWYQDRKAQLVARIEAGR